MKIKKVVGALMESKGKILLLLRTDGTWGLPGGKIEEGEDALTAVAREISEETGYKADKKELHLEISFDKPFKSLNNKDIFYTLFRLDLPTPFPVKLDTKEHTDYKWLTPKEAIAMPDQIPGLADVLRKAYYDEGIQ